MLGYEQSLPLQLGLYRLLMALVMKTAFERDLILNLGAGSAKFKKMRGGQPVMEWHAFYTKHLPILPRLGMAMTGWVMRKTVPSFLIKQGL
jgi:hypothetical protein